MFKVLIVSINSKYIHSSLASWYIYASAKEKCGEKIELKVVEATINEKEKDIFEKIIIGSPDAVAFSSYIWNIKTVLSLAKKIKERNSGIKIILGGPEVSYSAEEILKKHNYVDYISSGEGEESLPKLFDCLSKDEDGEIDGICKRENGEICISQSFPVNLENLPSPYCEEYFASLKNRIVYIESSRGCPFNCAFCLSGKEGGVRYFPVEKVKENILKLVNNGAKTVKFVDRTFNCNKKRAAEILNFIKDNYGKSIPNDVCFHFEIAADILDSELLNLISLLPKGSIQFEIGIQSFNEETLKLINRKTDLKKIEKNVKKLLSLKNCHIHIDLIAGLPGESFKSFVNSFNRAYEIKANMLQLGFLKILHGSQMKEKSENYPCKYSENPPYEVISTPYITEAELKLLHECENELERLYNSGRFINTLDYVLNAATLTAFEVFSGMADFLKSKGEKGSIPLDRYTDLAFLYFSSLNGVQKAVLRDKMLFDRISTNNSDIIPASLKIEDDNLKKIKRDFAVALPPKKGEKRTAAILYGEKKAVLFIYDEKKKNPITGRYETALIKEL